MKYIKLFETATAFESARATLDKPNVSLSENDMNVHYLPYVAPAPDPYNGHEYVEIGGLKWATMNVGANSVTDYGLYFQWGDTQGYTASQVGSGSGQKYFGWADYKYSNNDGSVMTKYNSTDGKKVLDLEDDAVRANWGGEWRMPTEADFQALRSACDTGWTQVNRVYGMLYTDKTDSSKTLFFPAAGGCGYGSVDDVGSNGYYWSSSLDSSGVSYARCLLFGSGYVVWGNLIDRSLGYAVRGVVD